MTRGMWLLFGLGLGAGLMYMMDPQGGRRRQSQVRDRVSNWVGEAEEMAHKKARQLGKQAYGLAAEARSTMRDWT